MKFNKEFLQGLCWGDHDDNVKVISNEISDTSRWSIHHDMIFQTLSDGKFYATYYSVGATEQQDERPYEYDSDDIECVEVEPYEVTVIKYREIKN